MNDKPVPEQPIKWLLSQIEQLYRDDVIPLGTYELIMAGYNAVKRRYDLASRLRLARQELALFRRNQSHYPPDTARYQSYSVKIERRMARIKMLEAELDNEGYPQVGGLS